MSPTATPPFKETKTAKIMPTEPKGAASANVFARMDGERSLRRETVGDASEVGSSAMREAPAVKATQTTEVCLPDTRASYVAGRYNAVFR